MMMMKKMIFSNPKKLLFLPLLSSKNLKLKKIIKRGQQFNLGKYSLHLKIKGSQIKLLDWQQDVKKEKHRDY